MRRHVLCSPSPTYASSFSDLRTQNDKDRITVRKDLISSAEEDINTVNHNVCIQCKPSKSNKQQPRKNTQMQPSYQSTTTAQEQNVNCNVINLDVISQPSGSDRLCVISSVEGNYRGLQGAEEEAVRSGMVKSEKPACNDVISDSDSDSSTHEFFTDRKTVLNNLRLPYTPREDEQILKFVLMGYNMDNTSSISLWKRLETQMTNPTRTYQSLKNRFLRNIKPHIFTKFGHMLDEEARRKVKRKFPDLKKPYKAAMQLKNGAHARSTDGVLQPVQCCASHRRVENATDRDIPAGHGGTDQNAKSLPSRVLMDKATNTENAETNGNNFGKSRESLTFKFSETIEPIPRNSQSVMKLVFFNHGNNEERSQSLLSKEDAPIRLNVEVTVSAASNVDCVALRKGPENSRSAKRAKAAEHSRCGHRSRIGRVRSKYVLGLKNCSMASWPKSRREALQRLMRNLEDIERKRNGNSLSEGVQGRVLRSQKKRQALAVAPEEAGSQANLSDLTNCSTNDDFGSTQLHEEVNRRYRLVMEADSQNSQADGTEEREKSEAGPARTVRRESARTENSSSKENSELQPRGVMPPLLGNMLRMTQRISNKTDEAPRSLTKRL